MKETSVIQTKEMAGKEVVLFGWVANRRDHGKLVFVDLRDRTGVIQVVFSPKTPDYELAQKLRNEWVIRIGGTIAQRPEKMVNPDIATGMVELQPSSLEVLSEAETPPMPLDTDGHDIDEDVRMKYRYLDLRRLRMAQNLALRHKVSNLVRAFLTGQGFLEVETPTLTKTSPEGARDFLVPSRYHPGNFYALPQSPQQYKQLLMIAGVEKYFQLAHCFRDEDLRGDRQFEHTQNDMEMSFVNEKDVRDITEALMIHVIESCGKKILTKPFPVYTHEEAVKKFGSDKFDLRPDPKDPDLFAFGWVVDFPLFSKDEESGRLTFAHNPFSAPKKEHVAKLLAGEEYEDMRAQQYDLVCNGYELASGGVRISDPKVQRKVFEIMGLTPDETEERFGHLIHAYEYGAPPHAGIAPGLDRLVMLLAGESDIREVIAFPMSSHGQTSVMDAPSPATPKQLKELHLKVQE